MVGAGAASVVVVLVADTLEEEASMVEVSAVAVSRGVAFTVAAVVISVQCGADPRSPAAELVRGVAATGVGVTGAAIGVITDSLMMSSSSAT